MVSIRHAKVETGSTTKLSAPDWDADHVFSGSNSTLLAGDGTTVTPGANLSLSGGVLTPNVPLSLYDYVLNFVDIGDIYIPAYVAQTIDAGTPSIGTGSLAYAKSTAAAPSTFTGTTLPVTLEGGAWLKVTSSGITTFHAAHLIRTA